MIHLCRDIVMGDPRDAGTNMGALISMEHLNKVKGFIDTARKEEATILCGHGIDNYDLPSNNTKVNSDKATSC